MSAFYGTDGQDTITGNDTGDYIAGFALNGQTSDTGADVLDGGGGNDWIDGGGGNDRINGGPLAPYFPWSGYQGDDTLIGGEGDDTIVDDSAFEYPGEALQGGGDDQIDAGFGSDIVFFSSGHDFADGGRYRSLQDVQEQLELYGDVHDYAVDTFVVDFTYLSADTGWDIPAHLDTFLNPGDIFTLEVRVGGSLVAMANVVNFEQYSIRMGDGDDVVEFANPYSDFDSRYFTNTIHLNGGNDTVFLSPSLTRSAVYGGEGNDSLTGGDQNAEIGDSGDTLFGEDGDDYLTGAASMDGGDGNDTIAIHGGRGFGDDEITVLAEANGGDGDDLIVGQTGGRTFYQELNGGSGHDTIHGGGQALINGGDGYDVLIADGTENRLLDLTRDNFFDYVDLQSFSQLLLSVDCYEFLPDSVIGFGATGTGNSRDRIPLDPFYFNFGSSSHQYGFDHGYLRFAQVGSDTHLQLDPDAGAMVYSWKSIVVLQDVNVHDLTDQNLNFRFSDGYEWDDHYNIAIASDPYAATAIRDQMFGSGAAETFNTLNGDDVVYAFAGDDTLNGGAGNDAFNGGQGFGDEMIGGAGNDTLNDEDGVAFANGGLGDDTIDIAFASGWVNQGGAATQDQIFGGGGNDHITIVLDNAAFAITVNGDGAGATAATEGDDTVTLEGLYGQSTVTLNGGNDAFQGGDGKDNAIGGAGADTLTGGGGNDTLAGGDGADQLQGGIDNDILAGGKGADTLLGGDGQDRLAGGNGDDVLNGGANSDVLSGEAGNDTFVFEQGAGADAITDFQAGGAEDVVDIQSHAVGSFASLQALMSQVGANTVIDFGGGDVLTLRDVQHVNLTEQDFLI